ncbi:MAG: Asp-tRNA(Asn)/Glu-tRNA(Gln) amidotransferase subunit GatA [Bacteroidetes bacterium]|nr:Asp-tRNA(Asn)/Glu-tRNA(Gln) amidotransferase subunit GatA [Bacteroidota bacterium]
MYEHVSIDEYHSGLREGTCSCESVAVHYLQRISSQSHINALVDVYSEEVLQRARQLDQRRADGQPLGKLHGVVIGIKDVICYQGHRLTAGSSILRDFRPLFHATVVERLLQEEALIIGSLNCDEFAMGSSNEHSCHGKVLNPLDEQRVPGGSSGGSAAAVAAGLCMASLGSDTGGSVRQPADFCGLIGLKPSYGRISRHGLIAYASSFDQIGILGKSTQDVAQILEVIAGADAYDATVSSRAVPAYSKHLTSRRPWRMAYFRQALDHPSLDPEIREGAERFLTARAKEGHQVDGVDVDFLDYIVPAYYILTTAEASSNLARYDGVRYGHRTEEPLTSLDALYRQSRSEGFGREVKKRIMLGTFVLSTGYFDAYYSKAQQARQAIVDQTSQLFQSYDLLILPNSPTTAFRFGEKSQDAVSMFLADIFTVYANLAGIPGISFPIGKHTNGMPFGIQALADRYQEEILLQGCQRWYQ